MKVIRPEQFVELSKPIGWVSGGAASAVACILAKEGGLTDVFVRIDPLSEHPDNHRFVKDLERLLGPILTISIREWGEPRFANVQSVEDVWRIVKAIKFVGGAPCTDKLKRHVRERFCKAHGYNSHIWGFTVDEKVRVNRIKAQPGGHHFPLIEANMSKKDCFNYLENLGLVLPEMYRFGFNNSNCLGCPKGGMGYWNHIRKHFPERFAEIARIEREIGASCLKECYLDELDPERGRHEPIYVEDCGSSGEVCEIQRSIGVKRS